jgi:hypothetical protein
MKVKLLYTLIISWIGFFNVLSTQNAKAQTITYKSNWTATSNYIFSELEAAFVPFGFEMTISGASSPVEITSFRINTTSIQTPPASQTPVNINTSNMFDLATPGRISKLVSAAGPSATGAAASPAIGTLSLNNGFITVNLNPANQTYTNGTYYFYLVLYVDLDNFIDAKNAVSPLVNVILDLSTTAPSNAQYGGSPLPPTSVTTLPAPEALAIPEQIKQFSLGVLYQWTGAQNSVWENVNNWTYRDLDPVTKPVTQLPGTWDRCYIGEITFTNQPTISVADTINNIYFYRTSNQQIILTVNNTTTANPFRVGNMLYQEYFTGSLQLPNIIRGNGRLNIGNHVQMGIDIARVPTGVQPTTHLQFEVTTLAISGLIIYKTPIAHTNKITLARGTIDLGIGIESQNTNSNSVSNLTIQPIAATPVTSLLIKHPTPLDTITRTIGPLTAVVSKGLSSQGVNVLDFNHPGSRVSYQVNPAGITQTPTIYAAHPRVAGGITYYHFETNSNAQYVATPGTLKINGNWVSRGSASTATLPPNRIGRIDFITNNTMVEFGGANQTIQDIGSDNGNGIVFKNVTFKGTGTKTLSADATLNGQFSVAPQGIVTMDGTANLIAGTGTNSLLTLRSTAAGSASVAAIPTGASITGNVNVERFITGGPGTRGYRMLSVPVNISSAFNTGNIALNYVSNNALTGGPGGVTNGFTLANNNPTMYAFLETETAPTNATFNSGKYKGITRLGTNNVDIFGIGTRTLPIGTGYILFFIGNNTNTNTATTRIPENVTLTARGYLNQGDVIANSWITGNSTLSYTPAAGVNAGLNLVGNPYASTIDLDKVIDDNPKIRPVAYQLFGNNYVTYSRIGGSAPMNPKYICSGQGFIVQAIDNNSTLTFRESHKVPTQQNTGASLLMGTPDGQAQNLITGFYMKMEMDSVNFDYCGIYFREDWVSEYDENDAIDIDGTSPKVFISSYSSDGVRTSINRYPDYRNKETIKLYVNATAGGTYHLKIEDIRHIDANFDIWLKDYYLRDSVNLRENPDYTFSIDKNVPETFGGTRFEIFAKRKPYPPYSLLTFTGAQVTEGIAMNWTVRNEDRYTEFVLEKQNRNGSDFSAIYTTQSDSSGSYTFTDKLPETGINIYRLKQIFPNNSGTLSEVYSDTIAIDYKLEKPQNRKFAIYPNPAVNAITIDMVEVPTAPLVMDIIDNKGNILSKKIINGQSTQHQVGQLSAGSYLIKISDNKTNEVVAIGKLIKL